MEWESLLSLKRQGDTQKRLRKAQEATRLGFEVDYDRIIFSAAFRSLQDKTQVMPLSITTGSSGAFVHTRLTHSLEVSVVGRSLGRIVGQYILQQYPHLAAQHGYHFNDFGAIVAAAALAHDIGNPPFGHSGEKAIGHYFAQGHGRRYRAQLSTAEYQDLITFEGNANGFKLLTENRGGIPGGLRLSYATLGAFIKYPKASSAQRPSSHVADKKFGFFQTEKDFFQQLAQELGLAMRTANMTTTFCRHPLAYLVEAADDICYTIIDFEDAINLGIIPEEYALEYLINLVKDRIDNKKYRAMQHASDRLSYVRALAINTLIQDAAAVFVQHEAQIQNGNFAWPLLEKGQYRAQIADIIALSSAKIYQSSDVIDKELAGYTIIANLLERYTTALVNAQEGKATDYDRMLLRSLPAQYTTLGSSLYALLLNASCFIASLSDTEAVHLHNKLMGQSF